MADRRSPFMGLIVAVLVAFLAGTPTAVMSAGTSSHYPGQKCDKCHKLRGKPAEKANANPGRSGGSTSGTGAGGTQTPAAPPKGAK